MNIGFYFAYTNITGGGTYTYALAIMKMLSKEPSIENLFIVHSADQTDTLKTLFANTSRVKLVLVHVEEDIFKKTRSLLAGFLYSIVDILESFSQNSTSAVCTLLVKAAIILNPFVRKLNSLGCDIFWVPHQTSFFYHLKCPVMISFHDCQEMHFPEFFSPEERIVRAIVFRRALKRSDHIVTSYNHVRNDLIHFFKVDPAKITTCPIPPLEWVEMNDATPFHELQKKFDIQDEYVLYPAATWEHKNHRRLIEAIGLLKSEGIDIKLVCTGANKSNYASLCRLISERQLSGNICFLGLISQADLNGLYNRAKLVVIPTLYEAGCGPLMEAMCFRAPVICSNVTSLPETIGSEEFIFNPLDTTEIANKIKKGMYDKQFIERNLLNSTERVIEFAEIDYARKFVTVLKNSIDRWQYPIELNDKSR